MKKLVKSVRALLNDPIIKVIKVYSDDLGYWAVKTKSGKFALLSMWEPERLEYVEDCELKAFLKLGIYDKSYIQKHKTAVEELERKARYRAYLRLKEEFEDDE